MTKIPFPDDRDQRDLLAILGGTAVYAQDKYSLKSPDGIAFSDFKGYEDWAVVSSARLTKCSR